MYLPYPEFRNAFAASREYNQYMSDGNPGLERVLRQLSLYEHPLLAFDARAKGDAVEVSIRFKDPATPVHVYYFDVHPRDLENKQFEWSFQRQLYDCLHDYFIEMFSRTPQTKRDNANL
jgi:hypothetical protein